MYKVSENSCNMCSIEFPLWTAKKKKIHFLKKVLFPFYNEHTSIVGEINGLDFSIEKFSNEFRTKDFYTSQNQDGYATLIFSTSEKDDFLTILSNFDCWSEGYYLIYIVSPFNLKLNELSSPLFDYELDDYLLKLSIHSDSTLFNFEFKNDSMYKKFIKLVK